MELNPKQKAKELFEKYDFVYIQNYTSMFEVKQCVLIMIDEIIENNPCYEDSDRGGNFRWMDNTYYWEEVKKEVQNYE